MSQNSLLHGSWQQLPNAVGLTKTCSSQVVSRESSNPQEGRGNRLKITRTAPPVAVRG